MTNTTTRGLIALGGVGVLAVVAALLVHPGSVNVLEEKSIDIEYNSGVCRLSSMPVKLKAKDTVKWQPPAGSTSFAVDFPKSVFGLGTPFWDDNNTAWLRHFDVNRSVTPPAQLHFPDFPLYHDQEDYEIESISVNGTECYNKKHPVNGMGVHVEK